MGMLRSALVVGVVSTVAGLGVAACGSSSGNGGTSSTTSSGKTGGTANVLMGTAPDYLDPQRAYTTQGAEAHWISYLGLYTYAHENGVAGSKVIPGLATDFPQVSNGGKAYTVTLRPGLKYSDGSAVKASDFRSTIERAIKAPWGGKSFFTGYIAGALAYDTNKAKSISGIKADDATGKITINLTKPYGAFLNVIAFPAAGLVPSTTKLANLSNNPPPGVGPYIIKDVVPNRSFKVARNPSWTDSIVPGVPRGKMDINVKIATNTQTEAEQVINNQADVFDWGDQLPPSLAYRSAPAPATASSSRTRSRRTTSFSTPSRSRSTTRRPARRSTWRSTAGRSRA